MKNVKRFIKHCKKITLSGNIKYDPQGAYLEYSRYPLQKKRKDLTRLEVLDAYFMVTEWLNGHALMLKIDDKILHVVPHRYDDSCHFIDIDTGELMATMGIGYVEYTTDWAEGLYQWGK